MFLKNLKIEVSGEIIRDVSFGPHLNLIVDASHNESSRGGNDLGKTTFLRLVDFCLGAKASIVYNPSGKRGKENKKFKDFLYDNKALIILTLVDTWGDEGNTYVIQRNFAREKKNRIYSINDFTSTNIYINDILSKKLFSGYQNSMPSYRSIIAHNFRCTEASFDDFVEMHNYAKGEQIESLCVYLLGGETSFFREKYRISERLKWEKKLLKVLQEETNEDDCKKNIEELSKAAEIIKNKIQNFFVNPDINTQIAELTEIRGNIRTITSDISTLKAQERIIMHAQQKFQHSKFTFSLDVLKAIYEEAHILVPDMQHKFHELVDFHNAMLDEKCHFISEEIELVNTGLEKKKRILEKLTMRSEELGAILMSSVTAVEMQEKIKELSNTISQLEHYKEQMNSLEQRRNSIKKLSDKLLEIDEYIHGDVLKGVLYENLAHLNSFFSTFFQRMYGHDNEIQLIEKAEKHKTLYSLILKNSKFSDGAKQVTAFCFDAAYTIFARSKNIPHLDFMLTDKKESVDDKQLFAMCEILEQHNIQCVTSILRKRIPQSMLEKGHIALELSDTDKLFKMEEFEA